MIKFKVGDWVSFLSGGELCDELRIGVVYRIVSEHLIAVETNGQRVHLLKYDVLERRPKRGRK